MGITILSTAFFKDQIVNVALFNAKGLCEEKSLCYKDIEKDLLDSQSLEIFKEKFETYFKDELGINIYIK